MTASPTDAGAGIPGDVGMPSEEEIRRIVCDHVWVDDDGEAAARAILSLIRPAFEAKDAEIAIEKERADMAVRQMVSQNDRILSAEAKLVQAVEALELYRDAVRIDVKMEGPRFMGANSSALKRAWEADRARSASAMIAAPGAAMEAT